MLETNQINVTYESKDDQIKKYLAKIQEMVWQFGKFQITQVPRSKNKH